VRFARLSCGIALVAAVGACTDDQQAAAPPSFVTPASPPAWHEPADYAYVVDRRCENGPSEGVYRVTVQGGAVAGIERIDGKTASGEEEVELPTLGGLLDLAQTAADDGGQMTKSIDPKDGHPTMITFDVSEGAATPTCFVITEYVVRG
jgi:hypothetical protein